MYSEGKRGKKRKAEEKEDEGEEEEGRVWGQIEGQHEQLRGWIRTTIEQCSARAQMASGGGGGSTGTAMHAKRFKAINQVGRLCVCRSVLCVLTLFFITNNLFFVFMFFFSISFSFSIMYSRLWRKLTGCCSTTMRD